MLIDLRRVAPGDLPNEVFEEFVAGNNYGPDMVEALREHLCQGIEAKVVIKAHGVYPNKFKMRLEKLMDDIRHVGRINALLSADLNQLDQVFAIANELAAKVDELRANTTQTVKSAN